MSTEEINEIVGMHVHDALESSVGIDDIVDVATTFRLSKANRPSLAIEVNYTFGKDVKL